MAGAKDNITGLWAVGWNRMTENWWNLVVAGIGLFGVVTGLLFICYLTFKKVRHYRQTKDDRSKPLPKATAQYFDELKANTQPFGPVHDSSKAPASFGVFLGNFANPPTPNQARLLTTWDLIVLDPLCPGILEGISNSECTASQRVGRLDVNAVVAFDRSSRNHDDTRVLSILDSTIATKWRRSQDTQSPFTGVLLANWQSDLSPAVLNELMKYLKALNFDIWLEAAPPTFLTEQECTEIDLSLTRGIICRNGTIMHDGDRRNYFQMNDMRRTQRALAKHMSLGGKTLMMWETIDDKVELAHSVIARSFNWCRFNTTVSWIGPETALKDADVAAARSIKGEPLGAMMWLKSNEIMAAHDTWRLNFHITEESSGHEESFRTLEGLIPNLSSKLALMPSNDTASDPFGDASQVMLNGDFDGTVPAQSQKAPFSYSPRGEDYTGLGCFQLGLDASAEDFTELAEGQRRLKELNLLDRIQPDKLQEFAAKIQVLYEKDRQSFEYSPYDSQAVRELVDQLTSASGAEHDILKVYTGMHSGFHHGTHHQYWGLHDVDPVTGSTDIYISLRTTDRVGTLLHTFLSSRQYTRGQCLMAEISLAEQTESLHPTWGLPDRFVKDIEGLSSTELLLLSQRLTFAKDENIGNIAHQIKALCENRLIDIPTVQQLRAQATNQYLRDEISAEDLVAARLAWHADRGCQKPNKDAAISVFRDLQARLPSVLINGEAEHMTQMETVLQDIIKLGKIDASADILALSIFCAFRKLAIEEVYLEILDRNPLPNAHADQAACFAEMFALGSQCESYFDMTSNVIGRILADKQQAYYMQNQPPQRDDKTTEVPTSYASTLVDEDPNYTQPKLPWYYQVTFLGIFAVPALIDILLLTTVGHGLYLSTNFAKPLITMATAGLMFGLLLVGAIGTWIGNGGSYYLHSMAFPVMNMFVITRFIAGTAVGLVVGIGGMIVIGVSKPIAPAVDLDGNVIPVTFADSFGQGGIFLFYFITMSTYLTMLATLAVYQFPGFMFQSGRINTVACMPILLLSPIITIFVPGHDIVVYPIVLSCFLVALLASARNVLYKWGSWYLHVKLYSDTDIVNWYTEVTPAEELPKGVTDLGPTPLPRSKVFAEVQKEMNRKPWQKPTSDKMIKDLADSYEATLFLMDWYCKYSRTKMPYPYSPTWNLQCKTAIDTLKEMQKGLKLHNAFVHWRAGGAEVWCGVLYFVIALMDKWVALFTEGKLVGLSAADSVYSLPVGLSLCYYLVAAVCLDSVASPLWAKANKKTNQPISSLAYLKQVAINDAKARRNLYWSNWAKFFFSHVWGLAIAASLMWTFVSPPPKNSTGSIEPQTPEKARDQARSATIMFMAYVAAYTGLLSYQYNRIYTGSLAMADLMIAAIAGILVGTLMRHFMYTEFPYSSVIGLGTATWLAAILSMRTAKIGWPTFTKPKAAMKPTGGSFYYSALGPDTGFSQRTLRETYDALSALESEYRFKIDPSTHPGVEVMQILRAQSTVQQPDMVQAAFPSAISLVAEAASLWQSGSITIDLVPARHFLQQEQKLRAVSHLSDGQLHIMVLVGLDLTGGEWVADIRRNCKVIAESVVQAAAEARFAFSRDHSNLAELLAVEHTGDSVGQAQLSVPEGIKRQLEWSTAERNRIMKTGEQEVLRYLTLGMDCDTEWDLLPEKVRSALLNRCLGEQCDITETLADWLRARFCKNAGADLETHFARSNLGASLAALISDYAKAVDADYHYQDRSEPTDAEYQKFMGAVVNESAVTADSSLSEKLVWPILTVVHTIRITIKFFVVSIVADPEFQRELDYVIRDKSFLVRWPARLVLNGIWIYCKFLQGLLLPHFMFYKREKIQTLRSNMKGIRTSIQRKRVTIDGLRGPSTGFFKRQPDGTVDFHHYSGRHETRPEGMGQLIAINTYSDKMLLQRREEYTKETVSNIYNYNYQESATTGISLPSARSCIQGERAGHSIQYDDRGYVTDGSYMKDGNRVDFKYYYRKNARFDDELLRADFRLAHITINVSWCVAPPKRAEKLDKWIPNPKVIEATFTQGEDSYYSKWDYEHRSHPIIETTLNGRPSETPDMITFDWFAVLKKPTNCSFIADNPLFSFSSPNSNIVTRALGMNTKLYPVSTALARTHLWQSWKGSKEIDAATVRYLDEVSMRSAPVLRPYWAGRDLGQLKAASEYLESQVDAILARTDMDPEISSWSAIAYKYSDLCTFGQGGDARINTRTQASQMQDSDDILHVIAMDTGTWPIEGGGVSACRRDMVNDLKTIRWHVVAEAANDYSVPKFQIERNVQSLSILPLWGLDYLTPIHGVFQDSLDAAVQRRSHATRDEDIKRNFFPILTSLVKCSRAIKFTHAHIEESTRALLDLNAYFENRHWTDVWMSAIVRDKWHELWLTEDMENTRPISKWLDAERPTLLHLDNALDMWHRYLFIFSLPVPERLPDVFQASHHFAGASFGVLCKMKRNCTFHVWDHCISWREVTVFLSSAMSFDSPFVCTSLMSLSRMTSTLILHYADVVLPCADFFNPGWEVEIGTQEGSLMHRNTYARKIDPVVNGITNMERYKPIETIKSKRPTVTMLSHVRFVKDIKNAILAADIIVNDWGFTDYQLDIYGDMEKAPAYSVECKEILASKGLRDHVALKGLGNPSKVLEEAWIFLNSSISEGLPLAMGEAALFGVPVVCTDVGASFRVVTDPVTWKKFSAVVAPNDSYSLAKAQVNVLGMLDEWAEYTDEPENRPKLSLRPGKEEVAAIQQRMYDKADSRRKLGMMGRNNVINSFSSERYLREHEQLLWVGKLQSPSYLSRSRRAVPIFSKWGNKRESDSPSLLARSGRSMSRPTSTRAPSAYSFKIEPKNNSGPKYSRVEALDMV